MKHTCAGEAGGFDPAVRAAFNFWYGKTVFLYNRLYLPK